MGTHFADGGCIKNLDIYSAVEKCLAAGAAEEDITIDAIMCHDRSIENKPGTDWKSYGVFWRQQQIQKYDKDMRYIYSAMQDYPNVNFRYLIKPTKKMPGGKIPLDFDHPAVTVVLSDGYSDAEAVVKKYGLDGNADDVMKDWAANEDYKGIKA
jgi:hypothetical protein